MKDIAEIEAAFNRVLTLGVYHTRIEYPPPSPSEARVPPASAEPQRDDNGQDNARDRTVQPLRGLGDRPS
jgi:hypothetical protein